MAWTTVHLQVTTPLFNGGADSEQQAKDEAGIRVPSIRGAMRFWFRALAGSATDDLALVAAMERRVFGGIAASPGQSEGTTPSPLLLRIPRQQAVTSATARRRWLPAPDSAADRRQPRPNPASDRKFIIYLLGQGLGDFGNGTLLRPCVEPPAEFELKIGFRHLADEDEAARAAVETLAFASLWLTCTYGGVGARTRRGFGGLRITGTDGPLPGPWQEPGALLTPDLDYYQRTDLRPAGPLTGYERYLARLTPGRRLPAPPANALPPFPVLRADVTNASLSKKDFSSWVDALTTAGEQLRQFRANADNPGANYPLPIETAEWKAVIHGHSPKFPVGALGLPVGYGKDYSVNAVGQDGTPLRRSSPLWLRVVGNGNRKRLFSFAFHAQFLPNTADIRIWRGSRPDLRRALDVGPGEVTGVTGQWIGALGTGKTFDRHNRRV
jgi:hypothetical protein